MSIDVWFDPACPFTWVTSRWVVRTAPSRSLEVRWRSFSLAILHEEEGPSEAAIRSLGHLRVVEAVREAGFEDEVGHLYTELGRRTHDQGDTSFAVDDALAAAGLPLDCAGAEADDSLDERVRASMEEAFALVGEDVGVPVIAWGEDEARVGIFGPILTEVPDEETGTRIFDAVTALATVPVFSAVQRGRRSRPLIPAVGPD
jgi:hypothetical protein